MDKRQLLDECWSDYKILKSYHDLLTNLEKLPSSKERDEIIKRVKTYLAQDVHNLSDTGSSFSTAILDNGSRSDPHLSAADLAAFQRGEWPPFIHNSRRAVVDEVHPVINPTP